MRETNDLYPTPLWALRRFLEAAPACVHNARTALEPCAGDGRLTTLLPDKEWTEMDIAIDGTDFLQWSKDNADRQFDIVLTNPPYSLAMDFVAASLRHSPNVFMLLRLGFLGSHSRCEFMRTFTPDLYVLPNRPSFVRGKTDRYDYAWFHFSASRRNRGAITVLPSTPRHERI